MTEDKGRGIFASKDFKRGELIVVEKAVVEACQALSFNGYSFVDSFDKSNNADLVNMCSYIL